MAQTWEQLLFAHWRVPVERLREHVPPGLEIDTWEGDAWLGVTPFRVSNLRFRGLPPLPWVSTFLELNCRTYVTHGGERPGIWFFSLDASSRLPVEAARRLYKLPYFQARMAGPPRRHCSDAGKADVSAFARFVEPTRYRCSRIGAERPHVWESTYGPDGEVAPARPGTLEHFLVERYCLYTAQAESLYRAEIHHPPWPLQPAEATVELNTMPPDGLEATGEPLCHYSERQDVLIWELMEL